jgi:hypothetical protein
VGINALIALGKNYVKSWVIYDSRVHILGVACSLESGKVPDCCRMPNSEPGVGRGTDVYVETPLQPTHSCIDPLGRKTLYPAQLAAAVLPPKEGGYPTGIPSSPHGINNTHIPGLVMGDPFPRISAVHCFRWMQERRKIHEYELQKVGLLTRRGGVSGHTSSAKVYEGCRSIHLRPYTYKVSPLCRRRRGMWSRARHIGGLSWSALKYCPLC